MCGFAGLISFKDRSAKWLLNQLELMEKALKHRGPDSYGYWSSGPDRIGLAHRRLQVVDLTCSGNQPMTSMSGRFVIVFNGELYNFKAIKKKLLNVTWRGSSDTEVLLEAIEKWGLKTAIKKFNGMFSFAVYDKMKKKLFLVRDRLGEKPLYYGLVQGNFVFASELKAIKALPDFEGRECHKAVELYFRNGYIPAPNCIYKGIKKLLPGNCVEINLNTKTSFNTKLYSYWSPKDTFKNSISVKNLNKSKSDYLDELDLLLSRVIERESFADVSVGSFLSGGVDSSLITALMQKNSERKIETFSLGFTEKTFDESHYARSVAKYLGTSHNAITFSSKEIKDTIPKLPYMFDEPFGDPSALPTFFVSKFARQFVTVALTGDGGDELFGGYNRYHRTVYIWSRVNKLPLQLRIGFSRLLRKWTQLSYQKNFGRFLDRLLDYIECNSLLGCYTVQTQASDTEMSYILESGFSEFNKSHILKNNRFEAMMLSDINKYLPNDILTKVDRASMSVSLETRAPFLDHEVVDFALNVPQCVRVQGNTGKIILKNLLETYIPRHLFERPKMGFGIPIGSLLKTSLRDWVESHLNQISLSHQTNLNSNFIVKRWIEHLQGKKDWTYFLWDVLMYLEWKRFENVSD